MLVRAIDYGSTAGVELHTPPESRAIAFGSDDRVARHAATSLLVIPAERTGLRPVSESRNPVIEAARAFTPAVDYWVPARASPVEPGSLGRDDSPYAIALPLPRRFRDFTARRLNSRALPSAQRLPAPTRYCSSD